MKRVAVCVVLMLGLLAVASAQQFTQWSAPQNLGPPVNTDYFEGCNCISKNGLSLFFNATRPGGVSLDLYVSKRASVGDPWGPAQLLANVNSDSGETCPALSLDEHRLYFRSGRSGGCGGGDLYVSRRHDRTDDFGWRPPENLGCESAGYVNTAGTEQTPTLFEDETGAVIMYFARDGDIWESRMRNDDTFGPATVVKELSVPGYADWGAAVRRDGLEVIFASTRQGGLGGNDLWTATRASTKDPWSEPINLTVLNSKQMEGGRMSFSFDGRTFYFRSERDGGYGSSDIYFTTREKLRQ